MNPNLICAAVIAAGSIFYLSINDLSAQAVPDRSISPGEWASHDEHEVCSPGYARAHRAPFSPDTKAAVFRAYRERGYNIGSFADYEDDHIGPLCLGGADTLANRWPQSRTGDWHAAQKDDLEVWACHAVCYSHKFTLREAQSWFNGDWRIAYCKYVNRENPNCKDLPISAGSIKK